MDHICFGCSPYKLRLLHPPTHLPKTFRRVLGFIWGQDSVCRLHIDQNAITQNFAPLTSKSLTSPLQIFLDLKIFWSNKRFSSEKKFWSEKKIPKKILVCAYLLMFPLLKFSSSVFLLVSSNLFLLFENDSLIFLPIRSSLLLLLFPSPTYAFTASKIEAARALSSALKFWRLLITSFCRRCSLSSNY